MGLNLKAQVFGPQAAARAMRAQPGGGAVMTSDPYPYLMRVDPARE